MFIKSTIFSSAFFLGAASVSAAQPSHIERLEDWGVYAYKSDARTVCYALSVPKKMEPRGVNHGRNFFIVSPVARGGNVFVPQAIMGYHLKPGSTVHVKIDGREYSMFGKGKRAWTRKEREEPLMIASMKAGAEMLVEARSARGTRTRYTYSLSGVTAALKRAAQCH